MWGHAWLWARKREGRTLAPVDTQSQIDVLSCLQQYHNKVLALGLMCSGQESYLTLTSFLCVCSMMLFPFSPVWCCVPVRHHQWWGPRLSPAQPLAFLVVLAGRDPPWMAPQLKPDQVPTPCSSTLPSCHHNLERNGLKTSSLGKFLERALFPQWVCASTAVAFWAQGSLGITDYWEHLVRHCSPRRWFHALVVVFCCEYH